MRAVPLVCSNAGSFTGRGTVVYLLPGAEPAIVDAGPRDGVPVDRVADALAERESGPLRRVLITHRHGDHAGGAAALLERWPDAVCSPLGDADVPGVERERLAPVRDNEMIAAGSAGLWVLRTPGHAPDHVCFFEPRSGVLFAGDLVMNGGTVMIPATRGGDMTAYLESLRTVLEIAPRRIFPGHGDPIDNPLALIRTYISHRLTRERQVLAWLRSRPGSARDIGSDLYRAAPPAILPAAIDTVLAHLVKLERDGGIRRISEAESPLDVQWEPA